MKIRRFIKKRRQRNARRLAAAMSGRQLGAFDREIIHANQRANGGVLRPRELPASVYAKIHDEIFKARPHIPASAVSAGDQLERFKRLLS